MITFDSSERMPDPSEIAGSGTAAVLLRPA
jgi:hypothetical protein